VRRPTKFPPPAEHYRAHPPAAAKPPYRCATHLQHRYTTRTIFNTFADAMRFRHLHQFFLHERHPLLHAFTTRAHAAAAFHHYLSFYRAHTTTRSFCCLPHVTRALPQLVHFTLCVGLRLFQFPVHHHYLWLPALRLVAVLRLHTPHTTVCRLPYHHGLHAAAWFTALVILYAV